MELLNIPYEFGEWTSDVQYPYFVGELTETETATEDGMEAPYMLLTGFHRGNFNELEEIKEKIKKHFHPVHGKRAAFEGGTIAVFYGGAFYIPTGEADLKKLQITLNIKTWKGDL